MSRRALLVLDANVLIDYVQAGHSILELTVKRLGDVFVPEALLEHVVPDLTRQECEALGIQVVAATDEQATLRCHLELKVRRVAEDLPRMAALPRQIASAFLRYARPCSERT